MLSRFSLFFLRKHTHMYMYFEIMCILFCYVREDDQHDLGYDLIVLSNRDEDFHRPAPPAHIWKATTFAL